MSTLATLKARAVRSLATLLDTTEPVHRFVPGTLGDVTGTVDVPGRTGYAYVRLMGDAARTVRARNMGVPAIAGASVWVELVGNPGDREKYRLPLEANTGNVSGPSASTDNAIARWDGIAGGAIQNSEITIDDDGNVVIPSGTLTIQEDSDTARPQIRIEARRPSASGMAFYLLDAYIGHSDGTLVRAGQIGVFGNISTPPAASAAVYMYLGAEASAAYNNNTLRLYPSKVAYFDGDVGIKTITPSRALDINQGDGSMIADGYDVHSLGAYKEDLREPGSVLQALAQTTVYDFRRQPHVSVEELRNMAIERFGEKRWQAVYGEDDSAYRSGQLRNCPDAEMLAFLNSTADALREERRQLPKWQQRHYGLVADDPSLIDNFPNLVAKDAEGNPLGVSLNDQVGMLHIALKEMLNKVNTLETELTILKQAKGD